MRWISFAELANPALRQARENEYFRQCLEQAKFEQAERHHHERSQVELEITKMQTEALLERERISGQNEIHKLEHEHILKTISSKSALLDAEFYSMLKQQETWATALADTMRQVIVSEASTIQQERLKKLDHSQAMEKMRLECNLKLLEMMWANEVQNLRVSYDKTCDIVFRLVERTLGLGDSPLQQDQVHSWVQEAMGQTRGFH